MRILTVHNRYQQVGGEDAVFRNETALLRSGGHDVAELSVSNDAIQGKLASFQAAVGVTYSRSGKRRVDAAIRQHKAEVVHVHNFFPLLSPSMFDAVRDAGAASVWTLHNYRIACAAATFTLNGEPCEKCVSRLPLPAILNRCYRGSTMGSAALATSIYAHRKLGTWRNKVDRFIALNDFARCKYIEAGVPADKIVVKPNFAADPGLSSETRSGAIFVGRLSPEKGIEVLIEAWRDVPYSLTVVGDGPLRDELEASAPNNVRFVGYQSDVGDYLRRASLLVIPSTWYENFPMTLVEAASYGTPILASDIGALSSLVHENGELFRVGDAVDLAARATALLSCPSRLGELSKRSRAFYQKALTPEINLHMLEGIYRDAIREAAMTRARI
jgi:glycosyltransferase involved in cell wall biosynthesis